MIALESREARPSLAGLLRREAGEPGYATFLFAVQIYIFLQQGSLQLVNELDSLLRHSSYPHRPASYSMLCI